MVSTKLAVDKAGNSRVGVSSSISMISTRFSNFVVVLDTGDLDDDGNLAVLSLAVELFNFNDSISFK